MERGVRILRILLSVFCLIFCFAFPSFAHTMRGTIHSLVIDTEDFSSNRKMVRAELSVGGDPTDTDGQIYIFEIKPYQNDLEGRYNPVASFNPRETGTVRFDLEAGPGEKRLYSAFVAAVRIDNSASSQAERAPRPMGTGRYEMISERHYITNPEVLAGNQDPALNNGKKGLRVNPNLIDDALALNIKHAGVDIATQLFFGDGISYFYEGKTFQINAALINELDRQVKRLSDAGVAVTAILLNGWNERVPELNRPGLTERLPAAMAQYYAFNVETETGFRAVKAMASFLAKRYNGRNGYGKITNWVIGNEINNQYWNYMGDYNVMDYTRIFQESFRAFYTAIKSECANDNVMFSIDQYWNMEPEAAPVGKYRAREVVEWFNNWDYAGGRINWGLALHPYPYPLAKPEFWDDFETGKLNDSVDSPVVSFANLHVITDFMQNEAIRQPDGQVRKIFLTEQGFSSTYGQEDRQTQQAAAVALSYSIVESNPFISAYLLSRQEDSMDEAVVGLRFGLSYIADNALIHKPAWEVYRQIDNPESSAALLEFARGVSSGN